MFNYTIGGCASSELTSIPPQACTPPLNAHPASILTTIAVGGTHGLGVVYTDRVVSGFGAGSVSIVASGLHLRVRA
jgi:hypothetical protein